MIAVDLFAGAGGFSTGATMAGARVAWAGNHWPAAVECHARAHPEAVHVCQDLMQADWRTLPKHDLLMASPSCVGHTRARGKEAAHHDAARSTAWAVVTAAEVHRPQFVIVENVPEFRAWILYPAWRQAMAALGYSLEEHVVSAADHGVPQERVRLYVVGVRGFRPLGLRLPRRPRVPASSVIDWSAGRWSPVDRPGRAPATLARVRAGRAAHGDRFAVAYYGSTAGGRSLSRPLGTLTTRDRWALIDGDRMRMLSIPEAVQVMGFPTDYPLPADRKLAMHMLGNAVCPPVARDLVTSIMEQA